MVNFQTYFEKHTASLPRPGGAAWSGARGRGIFPTCVWKWTPCGSSYLKSHNLVSFQKNHHIVGDASYQPKLDPVCDWRRWDELLERWGCCRQGNWEDHRGDKKACHGNAKKHHRLDTAVFKPLWKHTSKYPSIQGGMWLEWGLGTWMFVCKHNW